MIKTAKNKKNAGHWQSFSSIVHIFDAKKSINSNLNFASIDIFHPDCVSFQSISMDFQRALIFKIASFLKPIDG